MAEQFIKTRFIQKHDLPETWEDSNFIPKNGEIIVYDYADKKRIKIGDGITKVRDLAFADSQIQLITWEAED